MTVYGDLDVSILNELREGVFLLKREELLIPQLWNEVKAQILEGRQVFIVCPLIDEREH